MAFEGELSFGGVPFFNDGARPFRADQMNNDRRVVKKHQPNDRLKQDIGELFTPDLNRDFYRDVDYPGRNTCNLAFTLTTQPYPQLHVGDWYYPFGAARCSVFTAYATSTQVKAMVALEKGAGAPFVMRCLPGHGGTAGRLYEVRTTMRLLPPRQISEGDGLGDGLYLVTLVDERYYWRWRPHTARPTYGTTWAAFIASIAASLGVTVSHSAIESAWGTPEPDSQLWCSLESASLLLDTAAHNVGRTLVRDLDGTYHLLTAAESQARAAKSRRGTNLNLPVLRSAGGDAFQSGGGRLAAGNLLADRAFVMPRTMRGSFPKYVLSPIPHFYEPRSGTSHYRDSYGDVYTTDATIGSGIATFSGGVFAIRDTAKAVYSTDADAASGTPLNASGLSAIVAALGDAHWGRLAAGLDEQYDGTLAWRPDGLYDLVWTWSQDRGRASLRVFRPEWDAAPREMQHCVVVPISGAQVPPPLPGQGGQQNATVVLTGDVMNWVTPEVSIVYFSSTQAVTVTGVSVNQGDTRTYVNQGDHVVYFASGTGSSQVVLPGGTVPVPPGGLITLYGNGTNVSLLGLLCCNLPSQNATVTGTVNDLPLTQSTLTVFVPTSSGGTLTGVIGGVIGRTYTIANRPDSLGVLTIPANSTLSTAGGRFTTLVQIYPGEQSTFTLIEQDGSTVWSAFRPSQPAPATYPVTAAYPSWPTLAGFVVDPRQPVTLAAVSGTVFSSLAFASGLVPPAYSQFTIYNTSGPVTLTNNGSSGVPFLFTTSGNVTLDNNQSLTVYYTGSGITEAAVPISVAAAAVSGAGGGSARSESIAYAAGTTIADATPVTTDAVTVYSGNGANGILLPAEPAKLVTVHSADTLFSVFVYPNSGAQLTGLAVNAGQSQAAGTVYLYARTSPTRWGRVNM